MFSFLIYGKENIPPPWITGKFARAGKDLREYEQCKIITL
jgi:hypothetical protein